LRTKLRRIEDELGRVRGSDRFGSRTIDLDVVVYDERIDPTGPPVLPDPDLLRFAHAIVPVAELDPTRAHPETGDSLGAIADRLAPGWREGSSGDLQRRG
jgi:2-amino-4-hydroxy-6-hydroxymethyldihydropteridine diphosphokinase